MNRGLRDAFINRLVETCGQFEDTQTNFGTDLKDVMRNSKRTTDLGSSKESGNSISTGLPKAFVPRGSFIMQSRKQSLRNMSTNSEMRQTIGVHQASSRTLLRTSSKSAILQDRGMRKARRRRSTIMRQSGDLSTQKV